MKIRKIVDRIYRLQLNTVNAYLIEADEGLILIDTGNAGDSAAILQAIESLGFARTALKAILLTHAHPDHAGSAASLKREVPDARIYASEHDVPIVAGSAKQRPMIASPGWINKLLFRLIIADKDGIVDAVPVDATLKPDDELPYVLGMRAIHVPGHSMGQFAFLLPIHGGVLIAGDACANMLGLGLSIGHEDLSVGRQSLAKLSELDYEIACFGHGKPIMHRASQRMSRKWADR